MKCEYGCGREARFQMKNGKWCCENYCTKCEGFIKRNKGMKGRKHSEETKRKLSENKKGNKLTKNHREKLSQAKKGNCFGENNNNFGRHHTKKTKRKLSEAQKKIWNDMNGVFRTTEYWKKRKNAIKVKPNKQEIFVLDLLNVLYPNKYKFVGDFELWVGGKNPDFVSQNDKKLIEYFGNWWHSEKNTGLPSYKHEQERINHFKKYGYNTLVIWENELKDIEKLKNKIVEFHDEKF